VSTTNTQGQHVVTAVIIAHDGAAWLPRIAEALLGQTRPVQRVVAVDTGSRDRSGSVLAELLGRSVVFGMDRRAGYGAAVANALRHRAANTNVPGPAGLAPGDRTEWVWLLHDDSEPAPDALEQLLRGAAEARSAAVLGPKVMDWADRRVLLEAGITIDSAGRRITGVEPREVDQGQHDGDRDVMAVSSAGMLVRRDVWDQVSGFDPAMALLRDDVDFCWRVHAAGHRVRVITGAVVYHLEATARNRRMASAAPRPRRMDRHNALLTLLANLPLGPALSALAGNVVLSALRTVFFLLAKRPRAALDELTGVTSVLGHPLRLAAARRRRARGRRAAYSRLRGDLPPGRSIRRLAEFAASVFYTSTQIDTAGSHHATDDPSDDDFMLEDTGFAQRILSNPGVLLVAGLTIIALVAERSLLGAGTLTGGALTPAWGGASALWHEYAQGFHPAGIGSASSAPPYVAVIAALATVLGGKPWLAIDVIMIGCIPLAGLSAFLAARRVTGSVLARVWAAAAYALLPVGMGAVAGGRFGSAVVFALIPLIAVLAARIFTEGPRRARRAAWAAGLVIAIAAAFVPLIWAVAVVAALLAAVVFRRAGRRMLLNLGITAVVPPILLLPWTLQVATHPALLFLEAGNKVPGLATAGLSARSLLLLSPGGPGLPPFWVTGGLALAALAALLLTARRSLVMAGWSVALLGLVVSVAVSRMLLSTDDASKRVAAWPGISLAIAALGLVLAAVVAADALPGHLGEGRWRRPAGLGVLLLVAAGCSAPVLAAASWLATGVRGPVGGAGGPVLPPFVSVSSDTALQPRTLVLRAGHGSVTYEVLRGADPLLGTTDLIQPPAAQRTLDATVSTLVAQDGGNVQNQGQALAALDIGYVLLPAPADGALAGTLNNVADLRPVSKTSAFQLWRVAQTTARVRVAGPGGALVTVPSGPVSVSGAAAPRGGGTLELAEPAGGWTATLNGTALQSVPSPAGAWAQAFRLPAGGGTLDISHAQLGRTLIVVLEGLALLVVVGLGLPGARVPGESSAAAVAAERAGGRRRERDRDQAGEGPAEPDLEPVDAAGGADAEPSRGSRLSRRAAATAGRTVRSGRRAAAAAQDGPGQDRPALSGPGLTGPGTGAPPSGPGTGRRGTLGASRSGRAANEDRAADAGAQLAMDAGADAPTEFGPDPARRAGRDAAGSGTDRTAWAAGDPLGSGAGPSGWTGAGAAGSGAGPAGWTSAGAAGSGAGPAGWTGAGAAGSGAETAGWTSAGAAGSGAELAGDPPAARPGPSAGGGFWEQDDSPTMLGARAAAPWEEADGLAARPLSGLPPEAARLAGAEPAGGQDDAPAADRGGRKRWRLGRKGAEHDSAGQDGKGRSGPAEEAPVRRTGKRNAAKAGARARNAPEQDAAAEYPPGQYTGAGEPGPAGTGPRRRAGGGASGPYPAPSYGSGEHPGGEYAGAGRSRGSRGSGQGAEYGDAEDRGAGYPGPGDRGPDYAGAGYAGTGYAGPGNGGAGYGDPADRGPGYGGAGYGEAGPGSRGTGPNRTGHGGPDYGQSDRRAAGYDRAGYDGAGHDGTGYDGTGGRGSGYGSGGYPQAGPGGGRRVSRGRLPGDDDALPPRRRGSSSGEYPAGEYPAGEYPAGAGFPGPGSRPGGVHYPEADYPAAPGYPDSGGSGAYPGDSSRSDPAGAGSAWSSPGRSVWEPEPGRGSTPAAGYPGTDYPGPDYPGGAYAEPGHAGGEYPAPGYPVSGDAAPGPYSGTEYPGPDYPAPEDYPGRRAHVARGREPADEPGDDDW
jgi:GT2 family glycosyltransferase